MYGLAFVASLADGPPTECAVDEEAITGAVVAEAPDDVACARIRRKR